MGALAKLQTVASLRGAARELRAGSRRDSAFNVAYELALTRRIAVFLRSQIDPIADQFATMLGLVKTEQGEMVKAEGPVTRALRELDLKGWSLISDETAAILRAVGISAGVQSLQSLGIRTAGDIWDRVNDKAVDYAAKRSAELVGMRRTKRGRLVPNPNPEWAITEHTRDLIRGDVARAFEQGLTRDLLADLLEENYAFSEERAQLIARTEIQRTEIASNVEAWKLSGLVVSKRWILGDTHPKPDICDENAAAGWIPIDAKFPSGDELAPAHPNCICDILPGLEGEQTK